VGDPAVVARCTDCVLGLVAEGAYAQAASFVFYLHKNHLQEWVLVKRMLLSRAGNHRQLALVSDLLIASKRPTLQESAYLFPGLTALVDSERCSELLD